MIIDLPDIVSKFIDFVNDQSSEDLIALFSDDAIVNDKHRFFIGKSDIITWNNAEFTGIKIQVDALEYLEHYGDHIMTAKMSGGFDKALFDKFTVNNSIVVLNGPMKAALHALYFTISGGRIVQLIITPIDGSSPIRTESEAFYVSRPAQSVSA
jgi:hypothetical protein